MLDRTLTALIKPGITRLAQGLQKLGLHANQVTVAGFLIGLVAALLIAGQAYLAGLMAIFISRLFDALDGALARLTRATDAGGFLDITLDFLFYASIPLAFAVANPAANALAAAVLLAAVLLAAFIGTGSSFLAFAVIAAQRGLKNLAVPNKSFYFLSGLTEATETLAFFAAMCVWPQHFATLAYVFAALCAVTIVTRIGWGWRTFS
jgi:phosphatidylglycerophosphate synthase